MSWKAEYSQKLVSANEAIKAIKDGDKVVMSFGCGEPRAIVRAMRENYKDITVEKLSKKFGYSTAQIYRIIKKNTGNNFNTVVITIRIQRAKYLLRNTDYSISQIANLVGLGSSEYFSRLFNRQVGCTPTEYRKIHKKGTYLPNDVHPDLKNKN